MSYGGEQCVYSPLQITVMLLNKLKDTAEKALNIKVIDCVISVSHLLLSMVSSACLCVEVEIVSELSHRIELQKIDWLEKSD